MDTVANPVESPVDVRYRTTPDLTCFHAGENLELVYSPSSGISKLVPRLTVQLLERCVNLASLDQHAMRLAEQMNLGLMHVSSLKQQLAALVELGFLTSAKEITERFISGNDEVPPPPITSIGMPTRNRPESLLKSLRSYLECVKKFHKQISFLIVDQSPEESVRAANVTGLMELKDQFGAEIRYAGPKEVREFCEVLIEQSGAARAVVEFCLIHADERLVGTGANRNALLLGTIDELTIQADDDSLCRVAPWGDAVDGLTVSTDFDPKHILFPLEEEIPEIERKFECRDIFSLHEQMLGKTVGACAKQYGIDALATHALTSRLMRKVKHADIRVLTTATGLCGDSGIGVTYHFLKLDGLAREQFLRSEEHYRFVRARSQVLRCVPRPTVSDSATCGALHLGLDNRQLLPPFMPVQRNQDGIFASLLRSINQDGCLGFLPWMVIHQRPERWDSSAENERKRIENQWSGDIVSHLIMGLGQGLGAGTDPAARMRYLGLLLSQAGSGSRVQFEEMVRIALMKRMAADAAMLESKLKQYKATPAFWADDVRACLEWVRNGVEREELVVASDLADIVGPVEARELMPRLVKQFGDLLQVWPDLRQAASELRTKGIRLGRLL